MPLSEPLFDFDKIEEKSQKWLKDILAIIEDLHLEAVLDLYSIRIGKITYYLINGIRLPQLGDHILALGDLTQRSDFKADDIFYFAKGAPCYFVERDNYNSLDKIYMSKKFNTGYYPSK